MKTLYILLAVVAVIAWLGVGLLIARGPQPEIIVPAEVITTVGFLNITNTLITSWMAMIFLIVVGVLATRSMKLMPSGFQNFVEACVGFVLDQVEQIAGEVNGRRFFAATATFFFFIIVANWMALLPIFNAIGTTEDVGHEIFHEIQLHHEDGHAFEEEEEFAGWFMDESTGFVFTKPGGESAEFAIEAETEPGTALDEYIVFLAAEFTDFEREGEGEGHPSAAEVQAAAAALEADPDAPKLLSEGEGESEGHAVPSPALGQGISGVHFPGQKLALVIPVFRSAFSDVNNTIALGICSFILVEFWGFQSLGLGYLKKFFNFSSPITAFVGILELISEFIRIVSFAFRLFGNIFAGEVLIIMLTFLMPFLLVDLIYGLELFVGFIQAAVFALLTLVFAVMAVEHHDEEEHHDAHHGEDAAADAHHHEGAAQAR